MAARGWCSQRPAATTPIHNSNVWLMLPLLAGVGAVVSAVTAWVTLRFYLKV